MQTLMVDLRSCGSIKAVSVGVAGVGALRRRDNDAAMRRCGDVQLASAGLPQRSCVPYKQL